LQIDQELTKLQPWLGWLTFLTHVGCVARQVSSAYLNLRLRLVGRSLVYNLNKVCAKTEPCWRPLRNGLQQDSVLVQTLFLVREAVCVCAISY